MDGAAQSRRVPWARWLFLPRPLRIAYYLVLALLLLLSGIGFWGLSQPGSVSGQPFLIYLAQGTAGLVEALLGVLMLMNAERARGQTSAEARQIQQAAPACWLLIGSGLAFFASNFSVLLIHPQQMPLLTMPILFGAGLLLAGVSWVRRRWDARGNEDVPMIAPRPARVSWLSVALGIIILAITIGSFGWLLHDLPTLVPLAEFHSAESIEAVSWAPNGQTLAAVDDTGRISILSPTDGHVLRSFQACNIEVGNAVRWAPDGTRVALRCPHPQIQGNDSNIIQANEFTEIWDVTTGRMVLELSEDNIAYEPWCAWSPDGSHIAAVDDHGILHIWESTNGQETRTIHLPDQYYDAIAWAPDGHALALGAGRGSITLVDAHTWRVSATFTADVGIAHLLAWSPDSQRLAAADYVFDRPCAVAVLSARTGQPIATFRGHTDSVNSLSWSPDGRYITSGGDDQTVRVWTSDTGKAVYTWHGHFEGVRSVQWSPDGRYIASGSWDHTVQVWQPDLLGA